MLCIPVVFKDVAWDKAPHWGKKGKKSAWQKQKKKTGERSEPRCRVGREKGPGGGGSAALASSPGHCKARFACRYFSYKTPFFTLFLHCGAWSQAMKDGSDAIALHTMSPLKSHAIKSSRYRANDSVKSCRKGNELLK